MGRERAETRREGLHHVLSDQYSAVYFSCVKTLTHSGLEHTHTQLTSWKKISASFSLKVKPVTWRNVEDDAGCARPALKRDEQVIKKKGGGGWTKRATK